MIHCEFVPNGRAVDEDLYSQQLERVHVILRRRYPALINRYRVLLQQDKVRLQTVRTIVTKIQELGRIELLSHPAYSPDLAPSDYHLFRSMPNSCMQGISKTLKLWNWVSPKTRDWHRRGIINLTERWLKTIESDGLYFEE